MLKYVWLISLGIWCNAAVGWAVQANAPPQAESIVPVYGTVQVPSLAERWREKRPARPPWENPFGASAATTADQQSFVPSRRGFTELAPYNPLDAANRFSLLASALHHPANRPTVSQRGPVPEARTLAQATTGGPAPSIAAPARPVSERSSLPAPASSPRLPLPAAANSLEPPAGDGAGPALVPAEQLFADERPNQSYLGGGLPSERELNESIHPEESANQELAASSPSRASPVIVHKVPAPQIANEAHPERSGNEPALGSDAEPLPAPPATEVLSPDSQVAKSTATTPTTPPVATEPVASQPAADASPAARSVVAESVLEPSTTPAVEPTKESAAVQPSAEESARGRASSVLAEPETTPRTPATNASRATPAPAAVATSPAVAAGSVWPEVKSLHTLLNEGADRTLGSEWNERIADLLRQIETAPSLTDPRIEISLQTLAAMAHEIRKSVDPAATSTAEGLASAERSKQLRLALELERRIDIWRLAAEIAAGRAAAPRSATSPPFPADAGNRLAEIPPAWREFLLLDERSLQGVDAAVAAQRTLARMYSQALEPTQRQAVEQWVPASLESALRSIAAPPPALTDVLRDIEAYHHHPNGRTAAEVVRHFQQAYWSDAELELQLAAVLNQWYRNANLRLTISPTLLNQLLAEPATWEVVAEDNSRASDEASPRNRNTPTIQAELVPDPSSWNLSFATRSGLLSRAPGTRDGFVLHNWSGHEMRGARRVAVSIEGERREIPAFDQLTDSTWEPLPASQLPAEPLAAEVANPATPRTKVRLRIQQRIEQEVQATLRNVRERLKREVVQPLAALDLEPQPIEMSTTATELVLRYRLAGMDQLAADTPRPAVPSARLATLQVHESFLNNFLARLDLADQEFTAQELRAQLRSRIPQIEWGPEASPASEPNVSVQFAPYDPLRVDLVDGGLNLSLRFKRLQLDPTSEGWRNVTIATRYVPELSGFRLHLQQVGGVSASSKSLSRGEEIAIAGAFAGLLKSEYQLELLPPAWQAAAPRWAATVESLKISDGWLSVVWNSANSPAASEEPEHGAELFRPRRRTQLR